MLRKLLAIAAMLALIGLVVSAGADGTFNPPSPIEIDDSNQSQSIDSTCACVADTIKGPALAVFGAFSANLQVTASAGGCSLIVAQVSHNGAVWLPAATYLEVTNYPTYAVYDSLNQGGVVTQLLPRVTGSLTAFRGATIPFAYARLCVIRRTGYTTTTASDGPTVACRTRLTGLQFGGSALFDFR